MRRMLSPVSTFWYCASNKNWKDDIAVDVARIGWSGEVSTGQPANSRSRLCFLNTLRCGDSPLFGPWTLASYFPVGAILFLNHRWKMKVKGELIEPPIHGQQ